MLLSKSQWSCWLFLVPMICAGQSWESFGAGVVSCQERAAIIVTDEGRVSYVSLGTAARKWQVTPNALPDSGPGLAGNTILVLGDHFSVIYAFSKTTGKRLWSKSIWTSYLTSDRNYFYVLDVNPRRVYVLDPASGAVVWSLRLPRWRSSTQERPEYFAFLKVHNGLLFTGDLVIDISKRTIVHRWPAESFNVSSVYFAHDDTIFLVGSWGNSGMIAVYDKNFNRIRKFRVGKGEVEEIWSTGEQTVALLEYGDSYGTQTTLVSLTHEGTRLWRIQWPARSMGFSIAGDNVFMIEPGKIYGDFRLTSRQLSTGKLIWATRSGDFYGGPFLCGDTVYLTKNDRLDGFNKSNGRKRQ